MMDGQAPGQLPTYLPARMPPAAKPAEQTPPRQKRAWCDASKLLSSPGDHAGKGPGVKRARRDAPAPEPAARAQTRLAGALARKPNGPFVPPRTTQPALDAAASPFPVGAALQLAQPGPAGVKVESDAPRAGPSGAAPAPPPPPAAPLSVYALLPLPPAGGPSVEPQLAAAEADAHGLTGLAWDESLDEVMFAAGALGNPRSAPATLSPAPAPSLLPRQGGLPYPLPGESDEEEGVSDEEEEEVPAFTAVAARGLTQGPLLDVAAAIRRALGPQAELPAATQQPRSGGVAPLPAAGRRGPSAGGASGRGALQSPAPGSAGGPGTLVRVSGDARAAEVARQRAAFPPETLEHWGVPPAVCRVYRSLKGMANLYAWQAAALGTPGVADGGSFVYCAPTSGGKTLVAEVLMLRALARSGRAALLALPFVALCDEKAAWLEKVCQPLGPRVPVRRFYGAHGGPLPARHLGVLVCTFEKANALVSRLVEADRLHELAIVVVDELHMLGDADRGAHLELLLTKLLYVSTATEEVVHASQGDGTKLPTPPPLASQLARAERAVAQGQG